VLEGIADGDEAAHGVAEEHDGEIGQGVAGIGREEVEVVDVVVEAADLRARAAAAPMAAEVEREDGVTVGRERRYDVTVTTGVLAVAVGEQGDRAG
jgi:hypothetical protein